MEKLNIEIDISTYIPPNVKRIYINDGITVIICTEIKPEGDDLFLYKSDRCIGIIYMPKCNFTMTIKN